MLTRVLSHLASIGLDVENNQNVLQAKENS